MTFSFFIRNKEVAATDTRISETDAGRVFDTLREAYNAAIPSEALFRSRPGETDENYWHVFLFAEVCKRFSSLGNSRETALLIAYSTKCDDDLQKMSEVYLYHHAPFPIT